MKRENATSNNTPKYVRHYTVRNSMEEPTTSLGWKDGVLMQKWKIYEVRDIYLDQDKKEYSHTERFSDIEWRPIPVIIT